MKHPGNYNAGGGGTPGPYLPTAEDTHQYTVMSYGIENLTLTGSGNTNGTGNAADNVITGNAGNNMLTGGAGMDTLTGNGGADTFVFKAPTNGMDIVTDFTQGADALEFSAAGFGAGLQAGSSPMVLNAADQASVFSPGTGGYFIFDNSGLVPGHCFGTRPGAMAPMQLVSSNYRASLPCFHPTFKLPFDVARYQRHHWHRSP